MSLPKDSIRLDNFIVENNLTVKAVKSLVKKQNIATVTIGDQKYASKGSLDAAFVLEFEVGMKKAQQRKQFAADKARYNELVWNSFQTVLSQPKKAEEVTNFYRSAANKQTELKIQYSKHKLATLKELQKELEVELEKLNAAAKGNVPSAPAPAPAPAPTPATADPTG